MEAACDFSSSLSLAFLHRSDDLAPWRRLTLGVPAAAGRWPAVAGLERSLADLMGVESVVIGRSTLHLLWDIASCYQKRRTTVIIDEHAYPILSWCMGRSSDRDDSVVHLQHHDAEALARQCRTAHSVGRFPLVVTDSYCCVCGRAPDLSRYVEIVSRYRGNLVIDDTQGLGIFGERPNRRLPWGAGGGGSLRWQEVQPGDSVVVVASMAKAFGAPLALVGGSDAFVQSLRLAGNSLWHCSQPTHVDIQAGVHALVMNRIHGDERRARLRMLIGEFQLQCRRNMLEYTEAPHPTQSIVGSNRKEVIDLVAALASKGIKCLAGRDHMNQPRLLFLLNASHHRQEVRHAVAWVAALKQHTRSHVRDRSGTQLPQHCRGIYPYV